MIEFLSMEGQTNSKVISLTNQQHKKRINAFTRFSLFIQGPCASFPSLCTARCCKQEVQEHSGVAVGLFEGQLIHF